MSHYNTTEQSQKELDDILDEAFASVNHIEPAGWPKKFKIKTKKNLYALLTAMIYALIICSITVVLLSILDNLNIRSQYISFLTAFLAVLLLFEIIDKLVYAVILCLR